MSSRSDILSNLRRNLKTPSDEEEASSFFSTVKKEISLKELFTRFCYELERVDGECISVISHDEAIQTILKIIEPLNLSELVIAGVQLLTNNNYYTEIEKVKKGISVREYSTGYNLSTMHSDCVAIIAASYLIAETGTVVLISSKEQPRAITILPEMLLVIAEENQIVPDYETILKLIKSEDIHGNASVITFMTGPSRTADIEKILVKGVHGPKRVIVVLVKS